METPTMQTGDWPLPEYFEDDTSALMLKLIRETSTRIGLPITYAILQDVITGAAKKDIDTGKKLVRLYRKVHRPLSHVERRYVEEEIKEVSRRQATRLALVQLVDMWQEDRINDMEAVFTKAITVGQGITDLGLNPFLDAEKILSREENMFRPIRTLISDLDAHLPHGGICLGDLAVVLSITGVGKTMFLISCAKAAILQRKKVVYFTLEMSEADISERFISSFSGIELRYLYERKRRASRMMKNFGRLFANGLLIKHFPAQTASVRTLDAHLRMVHAHLGYRPEMIVVDYAGEMAGVTPVKRRGSSERYYELGSVFSELTRLAQER
ncbi:MAG: hypothetical protein LN415_09805, partial [Candidatus Thermoplasmatota archaeon]|nr:hypothetical protein [Candidatus Thermoplasmatota archaeon]